MARSKKKSRGSVTAVATVATPGEGNRVVLQATPQRYCVPSSPPVTSTSIGAFTLTASTLRNHLARYARQKMPAIVEPELNPTSPRSRNHLRLVES